MNAHFIGYAWIFLWILEVAQCADLFKRFRGKAVKDEVVRGQHALHTHEETGHREQWNTGLEEGGGISQAAFTVREALRVLQPLRVVNNRPSGKENGVGTISQVSAYATTAFKFLFMNTPSQPSSTGSRTSPRIAKPLAQAIGLLETAAEEQDPDAIFLLAEMNFFGNYTHVRNYTEAFRRYQELATLNGNATAQHMVGFMYATGLGGVVERDQGKALMYHTFAAKGESIRAQMTTGYRHHAGIGTPRNCHEASYWYKKAADKAIAFFRSGPPGGLSLEKDSYKIADEHGGVYGDGASVVSSGAYANRAGPNSDAHAAFEDVLEYLDLMSRKGDLKATFSLGRLYYDGQRDMKRNLRTARTYFMALARNCWRKDGSIVDEDPTVAKFASKAAGYLGRMALRGEGMEQNFEKAVLWFKRGLTNGDALCQYEMGLMHLHGHGVKQDALVAADYFKEAANQDFSSAEVALGQLYLDQGDGATASRFFDLAARHGHIEAFYHLAEMSSNGIGREKNCNMATAYYKLVTEKVESLHSSFEEANRAYENGDSETALVLYMMAAEQGYEAAQVNVAYMLDEHQSVFSLDSYLPWKHSRASLLKNAFLALIYWTRSAKQSNIDAMVKMGDYYLGGHGIETDMEKAATCYQEAAQTHQSAQALWNLGWIHENGIGVEQDFHLAKRFYDQALATNQEAYLPVKLSLTKLRVRSFWNTITNGKINSIHSEPEAKKESSFKDWFSKLRDEAYRGMDGEDDYLDDSLPDHMPGYDDDYYDDFSESMIESLIIVGLAATLAFLVYYRQQRQLRGNNGQQQNQPGDHQAPQDGAAENGQAQGQEGVDDPQIQPAQAGQQPNGGFFPPPEDPNFGNWVAGGVGH